MNKKLVLFFGLLFMVSQIFAMVDRQIDLQDLSHYVTHLVMQVGVIIICAKLFGSLFERFGLPSVLGEIFCGIVIGPYLLGSIALPGFEHGLFPKFIDSAIHVTPELYGFATIASIILLFIAGLKTDLDLLLRYFYSGFHLFGNFGDNEGSTFYTRWKMNYKMFCFKRIPNQLGVVPFHKFCIRMGYG